MPSANAARRSLPSLHSPTPGVPLCALAVLSSPPLSMPTSLSLSLYLSALACHYGLLSFRSRPTSSKTSSAFLLAFLLGDSASCCSARLVIYDRSHLCRARHFGHCAFINIGVAQRTKEICAGGQEDIIEYPPLCDLKIASGTSGRGGFSFLATLGV